MTVCNVGAAHPLASRLSPRVSCITRGEPRHEWSRAACDKDSCIAGSVSDGATSASARSRVAVVGRTDRGGCQFGCSGGFRNRLVGALRCAKMPRVLFSAALNITKNIAQETRCPVVAQSTAYRAYMPLAEMNTDSKLNGRVTWKLELHRLFLIQICCLLNIRAANINRLTVPPIRHAIRNIHSRKQMESEMV